MTLSVPINRRRRRGERPRRTSRAAWRQHRRYVSIDAFLLHDDGDDQRKRQQRVDHVVRQWRQLRRERGHERVGARDDDQRKLGAASAKSLNEKQKSGKN